MGWQGLSVSELCSVLKDPNLNDNRSLTDFAEHVNEGKLLVLWSWNPGNDREPVPIPHDEFVGLLKVLGHNRRRLPVGTRQPTIFKPFAYCCQRRK